jgi:hypothetical protein
VGRAGRFPGRRVCESDLPEAGTSASQSQEITVKILKCVYLTFIRLVKRIRSFPQMLANASKQRQRQAILNKHEAERLDRICNPSKYRGK